jgi:hypothetical protein
MFSHQYVMNLVAQEPLPVSRKLVPVFQGAWELKRNVPNHVDAVLGAWEQFGSC